ncbi:Acetate kinase [Caulifigura coniformis]|uniref:Acetate kinase n=1 Tax=Caulifigura coniformis TaxID=2527983 RepID=A0A517SLQ7_9PLAN|nr:acetate/propionate family kinase [Caulifigura coniformis]QDT57055.1 Acetate kinase [Caulifigura coniformis]
MSPSEIVTYLKNSVRVFRDFTADELQTLVDGSQAKSFETSEFILHQGHEARCFGVVLGGTIDVSIPGEGGVRKSLGLLRVGETFNEFALMTGDAMPADLIARSRCDVLLIPVAQFQSIILTKPESIHALSKTIANRIQSVLADPQSAAAVNRTVEDPYGLQLKGERAEKILVINCGSSSLKYTFYDTADESRTVRGKVERIGISGTRLRQQGAGGEIERQLSTAGFPEAFEAMVAELTSHGAGVIHGAGDVSVVAHRVVHGGEKFTEGTLITEDVLADIEALNSLAPLHNPVNVAGIREMRRLFPAAPHIAVFDTAFHHTLPAFAYLYGLSYEYYEKHAIRRYGFHGTSHQYVSLRTAQFLNRRPNELRLVCCHLGNGSSVCAIDHGRSMDTSMGFTPAEGLIMGTRCGDIDAGVIAFLERNEHLTATQTEDLLNRKSGLLGLSGISSDMREVQQAAEEGNPRALVALKAYCYRVRKYIGAYAASMGGMDAVVFTGGIGQGSAAVRAIALQGLDCMGVVLDRQRNREADGFGDVQRISTDDSPVNVLVVPADEERMMAREALRTLSRSYLTQAITARNQQPFPVEVSAHHIHLAQEHVDRLFGHGHQLTRISDLSQPGQYACQEQLTIVGPKGRIERVRVLGPARKQTQIEIAMTEQFRLGIHPPIRESGDIAGTPGCTLESTTGRIEVECGVICAIRHIHMTPEDALRYGVRDKSIVRVRIAGDRELVFGDVLVRVDPAFRLAMHIDTDEANAANVRTGAQGYIVDIQGEG